MQFVFPPLAAATDLFTTVNDTLRASADDPSDTVDDRRDGDGNICDEH